ncbi:MAG: nickel pincer cofactor biosynthesis protein LarB [Caldilineae bacterium]|nr:MAG: nickel pincer cofactor biosynthesis protein LarB [Caldilineae bacterium]
MEHTAHAFANLDHERLARNGLPEVVYAESKTPAQVAAIMAEMYERSHTALATRADADHFAAVQARLPHARYHQQARLITVGKPLRLPEPDGPYAAVVCAGTSDLPVAEEAALTLEWAGHRVRRVTDVGVAGIHRLFAVEDVLREAAVCIVVAGMEGALPGVVAGRVGCPIVAVPTSVGYGANFGGLSALLAMLTSCAPGIAVVNIDNGFGAAAVAHRILLQIAQAATTAT